VPVINGKSAEQVVSPKVIVATLAALLAPVAVAALDAVISGGVLTETLGLWAPVAYAALGALSAAVAGWAKLDTRRV